LPRAAAQVIELRAADLALAHDLHGIDQRAVDREHALHAFAIGDLAHREALVDAFALARDADAFEGLEALAGLGLLGLFVIGRVDHLDVDLQRVAGAEFRMGPFLPRRAFICSASSCCNRFMVVSVGRPKAFVEGAPYSLPFCFS
jgi:hypothetical protein